MNVLPVEYNIYLNVFKYLEVIGMTSDEKERTAEEIQKALQYYMYLSIKATNADNDVLYVFIVRDNKYVSKSAEFRKILNLVKEQVAHVIVISQEGLKNSVHKFMVGYTKKKIKFKSMLYNHFKVDPRNNILVPKHTLCTDTETKKIMSENKIEHINIFPKIKSMDPQVIWINGQIGQLVKIERYSLIGTYTYYRVIVQ
jgi:DNA-directed RNA polymerase subunit H (RpoH/RPB5)